MSAAVDRREFLCAAGPIALGVSLVSPSSAPATSPPPPAPAGTPLKIIEGEGLLALPAGAKGRLGSPQMRVPGHINAIQFAPRGHTLVAASGSEIRAWDPRTGKIVFRLGYPPNASISGGRLTSVGSFALLVQPDVGGKYEIRHYAFGNGKSLSESPPLDLGQAQHTAFSWDGALMAVVRQEALYVYDAKGVEKWHESLPPAAVGGCCFFADGATLALATKGEVKLFAAATGKVTSTLKVGEIGPGDNLDGEANSIAHLVVSADGKWLAAAVGQESEFVCCWDVKAGVLRHRLKAEKPVGFTPDGAELIASKGTTATCWTVASGAAARRFEVPHNRELALSPDGKILASSAEDAVILIDTATGKHLPHSADPPGLPTALRYSPDGRLVGLVTGWGGWVDWDVTSGTSRQLRPPGVSGLAPVALSADSRIALYRQKAEYSTRDMTTGKVLVAEKLAENVNDSTVAAGMTANGEAIIAPIPEGLAVSTAKGRRVLRGRGGDADGNVSAIASSADGRWAAIAFRNSEQHAIDLYDLHAGRYERRLSAKGDVSQLTFAPDGHWLAAAQDVEWRQQPGNDQRAVTVYDPHTGRVLLQIMLEAYHEAVIALSPGGRMLARLEGARENEYTIAIWEVLGNSPRVRLETGGTLSALAFSPDGRTLAASIYGGPVFLWDLHAPRRDTGPPTAAELDRAWTDLRAADAAKAFAAIKLLAANPAAAIPFLHEKITPVVPPDQGQVRRLIDDLDHKDYRRRETAMRGLAELGERVQAPLKQALKPGQTPEVRERIERLLAAEERPTPDYLRRLRAIEAMEVAGTKDAGELLAHWATGAPGAAFTRDAEDAAKRLAASGAR